MEVVIPKDLLLFLEGLQLGDLVLLEGPVGSGKTTFVRKGLEYLFKKYSEDNPSTSQIKGLEAWVQSPSYNLIHEYQWSPSKKVTVRPLEDVLGANNKQYIKSSINEQLPKKICSCGLI